MWNLFSSFWTDKVDLFMCSLQGSQLHSVPDSTGASSDNFGEIWLLSFNLTEDNKISLIKLK